MSVVFVLVTFLPFVLVPYLRKYVLFFIKSKVYCQSAELLM